MLAAADPRAPLRVAMLAYRGKPHVGGQGVYVSRLSAALADLGHGVTVLGGPPYPELDPRVPLVELRGLDLWAPPHPMRKPRAWELKDWIDVAEYVSFVTGNFSELGAETSTSFTTTRRSAGESWHCSVPAGRCSRPSTIRSPSTAGWNWPMPAARGSTWANAAGTRSRRCRPRSPAGCREW